MPCEYWPGDSDGDSQPLPELSRLLAGRHSSSRNSHGDSAIGWNALLMLQEERSRASPSDKEDLDSAPDSLD